MNMSNLKSIEQGRAAFAYKCAESISQGVQKDYKSHVRKIPMMIKTNGLGNTFAFIKAKKLSAYNLIYEQIGEWLKKEHKKYLLDGKENEDLVKIFIQLDSAKYRAVTVEVLAFFNWLRRFADGLIEGEDDND
jgi:CRISPR-associated protein Cmr5